MSNKFLMIDIETTGVKKEEGEVLEIAILEVNLNKDGYFSPARSFNKILHYDNPNLSDPWILKTHAALLPKCKAAIYQSPVEVRAEILNFFRRCAGTDPIYLMGLNAVNFDIPWLKYHNFLKDNDTHYRVFELSGSYMMAQTALFLDRQTFFKQANEAYDKLKLPEGQAHQALYDCYLQLKTLNGSIKLLRK